MTNKIATFWMKSGNHFDVRCTELKTTINQNEGGFIGYQIEYPKGYRGTKLHQIVLDEIEAITVRDLKWWQ
jgi:hypothetical protein